MKPKLKTHVFEPEMAKWIDYSGFLLAFHLDCRLLCRGLPIGSIHTERCRTRKRKISLMFAFSECEIYSEEPLFLSDIAFTMAIAVFKHQRKISLSLVLSLV